MAHVERLEITGKIIPLRGVVGSKKGIEKASKVALVHETDVAYSDLVIEATRTRFPWSIAVIEACKLLPIGIEVNVGHGIPFWGLCTRCRPGPLGPLGQQMSHNA